MTLDVWLQIIGWVGSALLVFSVLQTKFLRLRILNGIASLVLLIYNAMLGSWPQVAMNAVLVVLQCYYVWKLTADKRKEKAFTFSTPGTGESVVSWFTARHAEDIATFHPGLADRLRDGAISSVIFHDDAAIGLVAFTVDGGDAELIADYVIGSYRDYAPGAFVYSPDGPLAAAGVRTVHIAQPLPAVAEYLRRYGFTGDGDLRLTLAGA